MYTNRTNFGWGKRLLAMFRRYKIQRGMVFGSIIVCALLAFELFNYTTTDFALNDLLGDMRFAGVRWSVILAVAFCGMDFAGIARLFTPEKGRGDRLEVWYMLGAWFLAATMNATLTWWGVSIALLSHQSLGNEILGRDDLLAIVPVFVAVLVWLIRILMIGMFSVAGERLFSQADDLLRRAEADWSRPVMRPAPAAKQVQPAYSRPARTIGADEDDDYDQRRRPVAPIPMVRPAPKPSASASMSPASSGARYSPQPGYRASSNHPGEPVSRHRMERR